MERTRAGRPALATLLLPSMLLIGIFSYYPAVKSLIGGFYAWNGFSPPTYVGLSQFNTYIHSATFVPEVKNLAILVGGTILITVVAQFGAAEVVCHMPRRLGNVAKYILIAPIVLPPIVVIEVWAYLLLPDTGLIDRVAGTLSLPQPTWLSSPHLALVSILLIGFPWISARVDGCSERQVLRRVVVPLSRPILLTGTVLMTINVWGDFLWPTIVIQGTQHTTISAGIEEFVNTLGLNANGAGAVFAALVLASLPMLLLVAVTMRYFVAGLTDGALKL